MLRKLSCICSVMLIAFTWSCEKSSNDSPDDATRKFKKEMREAVDATKELAQEKKVEYSAKIEKDLDRFRAQLADLKARSKTAGQEAKKDLDVKIHTLEEKVKSGDEKVKSTREAPNSEALEKLKDGWEKTKSEISDSVKDLSDRLTRKTPDK